ncbi:MAG: hypothetical protein IPM20_14200 [Gammaproteobacteria bacterium]|nr:hypothetical protein [Gammaproteobacteria bacterium]
MRFPLEAEAGAAPRSPGAERGALGSAFDEIAALGGGPSIGRMVAKISARARA